MNKRGRPPLDATVRLSTHIHLRLNAKVYDRLYAKAKQEGTTVTALIRNSCEPKISSSQQ